VSRTRTVSGRIALPDTDLPDVAMRIVVCVEDVSRADAPSIVIAEQRVDNVVLRPGGSLPFAIDVAADDLDHRRSYSVRAHVDMDGTGEIRKGDLISMQSYPVLTRGYGDEANVEVRLV
jgi:uncharacterized lipoprotein YbaY